MTKYPPGESAKQRGFLGRTALATCWLAIMTPLQYTMVTVRVQRGLGPLGAVGLPLSSAGITSKVSMNASLFAARAV
ncbi:hypothetical protein EYF80_002100 [Liparis tanakae]|uniref:Uncharacterized protein n=1 Tax=Liparis tanakae TaxID=230148 RepID=A0A4Z2JDB2_9TELE|nr:hypothetical protein EYF80_002100 [Liparis tanakae]